MIDESSRTTVEKPEIGTTEVSEMGAVAGLISRGMQDNPLHVAVYGENPELRQTKLRRMFRAALGVMNLNRHMLAARGPDGTILGVCGMMEPGECQPGLGQRLRLMPTMICLGPGSVGRMMKWMGTWSKHDRGERHWHLGPVAVDAHLQGTGLGSKLMRVFCAQMDAAGEDAYLETDKPENVRFYERFGFEVVGEEDVLGVPNWFMLRHPRKRGWQVVAEGSERRPG